MSRPARRARRTRARRGDRERRRRARPGPRRHARRARRGRPLPARLAVLARPRLARGRSQSERPRRLRRRARGPDRDPRRAAGHLAGRLLELYEGIGEARVPVRGGDTTRAYHIVLSVTAIGRSERVPGRTGARPGDRLVVTGPLGAAGAAFRRRPTSRPPLRLDEGRALAAARPRDARRLGRPGGRRGPHRRRSGVRCVIDLERVPLAAGADARRRQLRRGLRAARRGRPRHAFHRDRPRARREPESRSTYAASPYDLGGWDHFTA